MTEQNKSKMERFAEEAKMEAKIIEKQGLKEAEERKLPLRILSRELDENSEFLSKRGYRSSYLEPCVRLTRIECGSYLNIYHGQLVSQKSFERFLDLGGSISGYDEDHVYGHGYYIRGGMEERERDNSTEYAYFFGNEPDDVLRYLASNLSENSLFQPKMSGTFSRFHSPWVTQKKEAETISDPKKSSENSKSNLIILFIIAVLIIFALFAN